MNILSSLMLLLKHVYDIYMNINPELFHLVKTYQVHSHLKSCRNEIQK